MTKSDSAKTSGRAMIGYLGTAALACISAIAIAQSSGANDAQSAAWHNEQQLALAKLQAADGWRWEPGGMLWRYAPGNTGPGGTGARPSISDTVSVHYAGTLIDGTEFDSSYKRGKPAIFPLGGLIKAWQVAIPNMSVGDKIELAAPADMAYGPRGKGPIPGGATLFFTVELVDLPGG